MELKRLFSVHLPYSVIIRPALFMENIGTVLIRVMPQFVKGRFKADAKIPFVALSDIGKCAAEIFSKPAKFRGNALTLIGDTVSGHKIAFILSELAGDSSVAYVPPNRLFL